jgi:hypothetical protein
LDTKTEQDTKKRFLGFDFVFVSAKADELIFLFGSGLSRLGDWVDVYRSDEALLCDHAGIATIHDNI